jgi:sulfite exporter TauE/SafE
VNILAPFLIGLAGSLHCIGMCSPLAMAVSNTRRNSIFRNLQYNLGRILTYGMLGSIVSFAGGGLQFAGYQSWVSIAAGIALLAIGITNMRVNSPAFLQRHALKFSNALKVQFRMLLSKRNAFATVILGMINGLLPCGMTLVALGYCVTLTGPWQGFSAMLLFGLGTLPAMVGVAPLVRSLVSRLNIGYNTLQTGLIIVCAIMLIGRGIWHSQNPGDDVAGVGKIVVCGVNGQ